MYSKQLEELIDAALADGVLTEKEKQILFKKAKADGIDLDEFEMVLDARVLKAQQIQQPTHQAKEKRGNIITCPNCGAHVSALAGFCPECGHEFTNVGVISSAQDLAKKIEQIAKSTKDQNNKWDKMAEVINTFPIPNAKADLFEFAISMRVKMQDIVFNPNDSSFGIANKKEAGAKLMTACMNKYKECITKINILFPNDPTFAQIISSYDDDIKKAQKAIKFQRAKKADKELLTVLIGWITIFIIVVALHVWFYVDDYFEWWESMLWGGGTLVVGAIMGFLVELLSDIYD